MSNPAVPSKSTERSYYQQEIKGILGHTCDFRLCQPRCVLPSALPSSQLRCAASCPPRSLSEVFDGLATVYEIFLISMGDYTYENQITCFCGESPALIRHLHVFLPRVPSIADEAGRGTGR
ncbi:hypothetical protein E2C01_039785 [Portunus trituberculatus]|uniref:Uncharacterized protein n=1 Tax=Portunus trituberculatus TaxID=210409 RepID=A0A5B7FKX5_PORTR|nr:hypothetical protein [Portunus trituberculatus]